MLEERVAAWAADRERGSGALADEALAILAEGARLAPEEGLLQSLHGLAARLARARPAMVAIENRVAQVMEGLHRQALPPGEARPRAQELAASVRAAAPREREAAAQAAAALVDAERVLTVSWSDTAARALELMHARGPLGVVVAQGAPLMDGQRAAARLALAGMEVELVSDAGVGRAALGCDAALVGADAVLPGGVVVNRAGTSLAALAMAVGGRPLYVVCEEAKVTWRPALPLEEAPARDLWEPGPLLPVRVRNPLLDATPAELVRAHVTERGARSPEQLAATAAEHERRAAWLGPRRG